MNLTKLVKLARNVTSLDEALEVLSVMGIEVNVTPIPSETAVSAGALAAVIEAAKVEGCRGFYGLEASIKGLPIRAFVVVGKPEVTSAAVTGVTATA